MRHLLLLSTLLLAPASALAAPVVTFAAPTEANEGQGLTVTVTVTDDAGGAPTWSWDIDGDGTYGERPGETTYLIPPNTTDGDSEVRVAVEARGDVETVTAEHVILIRNVAPTFSSSPPLTAGVRRQYRYDVSFVEPAGAADPVNIRLTSRPNGMVIEGSRITWTPEPDQRGRSFPAILRVDDGDGGENAQMWEIAVAANSRPSAPTPVSPIERTRVSATAPVTLTVENAEDLDDDPLVYLFRLSRVSDFDTPDVVESEEVAEGEGGTTSWTTAEPLAPGLWYWQAWAADAMEPGPRLFAQLVVEAAARPDAGAAGDAGVGGTPAGGCAVSAGVGRSPLGAAFFAAALLALARARRRRSLRA